MFAIRNAFSFIMVEKVIFSHIELCCSACRILHTVSILAFLAGGTCTKFFMLAKAKLRRKFLHVPVPCKACFKVPSFVLASAKKHF